MSLGRRMTMPLTNAGIDEMALLTTGLGGTLFNGTNTRIAVGSNSTAFAAGNTTLGTETLRKPVTAGPTAFTGSSGTKSTTYTVAFNNGEAEAVWAEWGILNAGAAGVLLCRAVQAMGTKGAGQVWTVTATLTFGRA
jgi:hypothetical protein